MTEQETSLDPTINLNLALRRMSSFISISLYLLDSIIKHHPCKTSIIRDIEKLRDMEAEVLIRPDFGIDAKSVMFHSSPYLNELLELLSTETES